MAWYGLKYNGMAWVEVEDEMDFGFWRMDWNVAPIQRREKNQTTTILKESIASSKEDAVVTGAERLRSRRHTE